MSFYNNDYNVGKITRYVVSRGFSILQFHYLAPDDKSHVRELLALFDPPQGALVLDAGCGIGAVAEIMHEIRPDLRFLLLNISASQLSMCPPHFEQIHASFEKIPLADSSVDAAMFNYALGHGVLDKTMAEAARILRFGGVLFIYDLSADDPEPMERELEYTPHAAPAVVKAANALGLKLTDRGMPRDTIMGDQLDLTTPSQRKALATAFPIYYRFVKS